jgi:hypothetical protein
MKYCAATSLLAALILELYVRLYLHLGHVAVPVTVKKSMAEPPFRLLSQYQEGTQHRVALIVVRCCGAYHSSR